MAVRVDPSQKEQTILTQITSSRGKKKESHPPAGSLEIDLILRSEKKKPQEEKLQEASLMNLGAKILNETLVNGI